MSDEEDEHPSCDRCGAMLSLTRFAQGPYVFQITELDDESDEFVVHNRRLCTACEQELLNWIDDSPVDRSECVDLPVAHETVRGLENHADELIELAERIERAFEEASTTNRTDEDDS